MVDILLDPWAKFELMNISSERRTAFEQKKHSMRIRELLETDPP
jgi:hypothetical protein